MLRIFRRNSTTAPTAPAAPGVPERRDPEHRVARGSDHVFLIVDRAFGERLQELPRVTPAWIVDSTQNHRAIAAFGMKRMDDTHRTGITAFRDLPQFSANELAASKIGTIDELYQAAGEHPAYRRLTIVGATADRLMQEATAPFGLTLASSSDAMLEYVKQGAT